MLVIRACWWLGPCFNVILECFCVKHFTFPLLPSTYVCYISKYGYKKIVGKPDKTQGTSILFFVMNF